MKLLKLAFQGIGPFAEKFSLDFTTLNQTGLFLLEGSTGSGKSTILDAITFALYGKSVNGESKDTRIISTHISDPKQCWVELTFQISSGIYRIRRTPSYTKNTSNNTKTTTQNATAKLWKLTTSPSKEINSPTPNSSTCIEQSEILIANKPKDVAAEFAQIFPLSHTQFVQTIILPQGKFADFLKLSSIERESILTTIFQTQKYKDFSQALKAGVKEKQEIIEKIHAVYISQLKIWLDNPILPAHTKTEILELLAPISTQSMPATPDIDRPLLTVLEKHTQQFTQEVQALTLHQEKTETALTAAHNELNKAKSTLENRERKLALIEELTLLKTQTDHINSLEEALNWQQESQKVETVLQHMLQSSHSLSEALLKINKFFSDNTTNLPNSLVTQLQHPLWKKSQNQLTDTLQFFSTLSQPAQAFTSLAKKAKVLNETCATTITALHTQETALTQLISTQQKLKETEQNIQALTALINNATNELDILENKYTQNTEHLSQLQLSAEKLAQSGELAKQLQQALTDLQTAQVAYQAYLRDYEHLQTLQTNLKKQNHTLDTATSHFNQLIQDWINDAPGYLAQQLKPGQACQVCGSADHPHPAAAPDNFIDINAIYRANQEIQTLKEQIKHQENLIQEAQTKITHHKIAQNYQNETEITEQINTTQTQLSAAKQNQQNYRALEAEIQTLTTTQEEIKSQTQDKELLIQNYQGQLSSQNTLATELATKITEFSFPFTELADPDYTAQLKYTRLQIEATKYLQEYSTQLLPYIDNATHNYRELNTAIQDSPFSDLAAAQSVFLPPEIVQSYKTQIQEHQTALHKLKGQLESPELQPIDLTTPYEIDLSHLTEKVAVLTEQATQNKEKLTLGLHYKQEAEKYLQTILQSSQNWHKEFSQASTLIRLSDLANAQNTSGNKIPLSHWILTRRLDLILQHANAHLRTISNGRYELLRGEESARTQKTGLGLAVLDHEGSPNGETIRNTSSLSGGETFYTSLALALGLAEVVEAESGGTQIDTLLIDEGFGSLSNQYLEEVMHTLNLLRSSGRTVGVISHLEVLKTRIAKQIRVRKKEDGSSTLTMN